MSKSYLATDNLKYIDLSDKKILDLNLTYWI